MWNLLQGYAIIVWKFVLQEKFTRFPIMGIESDIRQKFDFEDLIEDFAQKDSRKKRIIIFTSQKGLKLYILWAPCRAGHKATLGTRYCHVLSLGLK